MPCLLRVAWSYFSDQFSGGALDTKGLVSHPSLKKKESCEGIWYHPLLNPDCVQRSKPSEPLLCTLLLGGFLNPNAYCIILIRFFCCKRWRSEKRACVFPPWLGFYRSMSIKIFWFIFGQKMPKGMCLVIVKFISSKSKVGMYLVNWC